ncbi:hypothetical protein PRIPAC_89197 [Pristionchus pacificus]|uniref:Uncharacterized protein n=1 Tax=Pristionchus pacificus TaxID=54126 RepID=A0A2A6CVA9_PRIPA|nr:hypothetical protein PRIPAC_89197 [Pristionchus pacificus]|eukprot:PDM82164.1 hypothetical protein PRIPAC_36557 [Pristionchus pacificus]
MKCLLALIALLFSLTLADYPLYIDELGDLVSDADERMLDVLDDDEFTPRSQLKSQFDEILNRQSPAVQTAYQAIVTREEAERMSKDMRKSQKYQARGLDSIYQQVLSIESDLSLSENQCFLLVVSLIVLLSELSLAEYPLYIDELADIVNWEDERILEQLEDDVYTPRYELLASVKEILERQHPALQAAYKALITNMENTRAARVAHMLRQHEMRGTSDLFRRILDVQGDLRLSQSDAKKLMRDLKRMLY